MMAPTVVLPSPSASQGQRFSVAINRLWPGEKLLDGDPRWTQYNGAFFTETHTPQSFFGEVAVKGHSFCAALTEPWRHSKNFASAQHLGVDDDSGINSLEDLLADQFIGRYAACIYPTISWTPDKPKHRVVFVLSEAITDAEIYRKAATALLLRYEMTDQKVKDPARLF